MSNQETPRRRRFSVWWGVALGLALGLFLFPVLALRTSRALNIADPLATPGPTPTSYWVFWIGAALAAFVPAAVLGVFASTRRAAVGYLLAGVPICLLVVYLVTNFDTSTPVWP